MLVHQAHLDLLGSKWHGAVESLVVSDVLADLHLVGRVVGLTQLRADLTWQVQFVLADFLNDQIRSDHLEIYQVNSHDLELIKGKIKITSLKPTDIV